MFKAALHGYLIMSFTTLRRFFVLESEKLKRLSNY